MDVQILLQVLSYDENLLLKLTKLAINLSTLLVSYYIIQIILKFHLIKN